MSAEIEPSVQTLLPADNSSELVARTEEKVVETNCDKGAAGAVIYYPNLYKFRLEQEKLQGPQSLTPTQWGLVELEKCHHISTTSATKDSPASFRVRICKTCCKSDFHIEVGTYFDQESAIFVNDVHEILNERYDKLIFLRPEDKPLLHLLTARKYDRNRGKEYSNILQILNERQSFDRKRQRTMSEGSQGEEREDREDETSRNSSDYNYYHKPNKHLSIDSEEIVYTLRSPVKVGNAESKSSAVISGSASISLSTGPSVPDVDISTLSEACLLRSPMRARPRSNTFAGPSSPQPYFDRDEFGFRRSQHDLSPMATLAKLASLEDADFIAAKTLSELFAMKRVKSVTSMDDSMVDTKSFITRISSTDFNVLASLENLRNYKGDDLFLPPLSPRSSADSSAVATSIETNTDHDVGLDIDAVHRPALVTETYTRRARSYSLPTLYENMPTLPGGRVRADSTAQELKELGYIGIYSPEERKKRIQRFLEKRKNRVWTKKVKYDVRKNFADSRIRVKGRFVKKEDEVLMKSNE